MKFDAIFGKIRRKLSYCKWTMAVGTITMINYCEEIINPSLCRCILLDVVRIFNRVKDEQR